MVLTASGSNHQTGSANLTYRTPKASVSFLACAGSSPSTFALTDGCVSLKLKQANLLAQNIGDLCVADTFQNCGQPLNHNDTRMTPNVQSSGTRDQPA